MASESSSLADTASTESTRNPWWWVPSLYFAQGVPYVVVMTVAVIMFKRLGVGNKEIALYTSWLYLPYAIKPLWSPLVQRIGTRRGWVIVMQLLIAAGLACAAMSIPLDSFVRWSLVALATVAVCSATHDVAADGFYLLALSSHQQAWFVGIRSTAYRAAMIFGQGLLVMLAGILESATGLPTVDLQVRAVGHEAAQRAFDPAAVPAVTGPATQQVEVASREFDISYRGRPAADVKALVAQARAWNVEHGFYAGPEDAKPAATAEGEKDAKEEPPSWKVSLEDFIRRNFGPAEQTTAAETSDRTGDVAIVWMRLANSVPEGEQQVVQFGRASGDASFQVIEGERFVLTDKNWQQPFAAIVQVDAKLSQASEATFDIRSGNLKFAWTITFFAIAASFVVFALYHFLAMPHSAADAAATTSGGGGVSGFLVPFLDFFRKHRIFAILLFLLFYRFPEAQLVKLATPFLLDSRESGGLALTTGEVGFVYGTIGVIMLTLGGIIGGFFAARDGLGFWLWPMALAIHLPNLAFLFLAYAQPESLWLITAAVGVEQFGYGFGFTAYLLYCVYVARGQYQTVHYALCTGAMALGMMIPGMWSGWLQELIGYKHFFVWIMIAMVPSILAVALIPLDPTFGKKTTAEAAGE